MCYSDADTKPCTLLRLILRSVANLARIEFLTDISLSTLFSLVYFSLKFMLCLIHYHNFEKNDRKMSC